MKRVAIPIETTDLCSYGCGCVAKFRNGSGNLMCSLRSSSCPAVKEKNSSKLKKAHSEGRIPTNFGGKENRGWAKGLTKVDPRVEKGISVRKAKIASGEYVPTGHSHTEETKSKLSKFRSNWLSIPENRKNYGRGKRSWMELCFEKYLKDNSIIGWTTEAHFRNDKIGKNYFVDFLFEDNKMIIELDGTQHKHTINDDMIRDEFISSLGYRVIRIPYHEFKRRYFSDGFLDILGS